MESFSKELRGFLFWFFGSKLFQLFWIVRSLKELCSVFSDSTGSRLYYERRLWDYAERTIEHSATRKVLLAQFNRNLYENNAVEKRRDRKILQSTNQVIKAIWKAFRKATDQLREWNSHFSLLSFFVKFAENIRFTIPFEKCPMSVKFDHPPTKTVIWPIHVFASLHLNLRLITLMDERSWCIRELGAASRMQTT